MKKGNNFHSEIRDTHRRERKFRVADVRYVFTPGGNTRLSRALDILLRATTGHTAQSKENPKADKEKLLGQAPAEDANKGEHKGDCP